MTTEPSRPTICTIVAQNYLPQARCLAESFLRFHPDGRVLALLVAETDASSDFAGEPFEVVPVDQIGVPDLSGLSRRYRIVELCTAVKPFFLRFLFNNRGIQKLCYFDPDIYFYDSVNEIFALLDDHGIILTPHLVDALPDGAVPSEADILQYGTYNLGFIGLARHPQLESFLCWWQERVSQYGYARIDKGLYVDQRWMDLVPAMFASVYLHRDPGCNVAYWNLPNRHIVRTGQGYAVKGSPLKFFHFSGFPFQDRRAISSYPTTCTLQEFPELVPLFEAYRQRLLTNGYRAPSPHLGRTFYLGLSQRLDSIGVGRPLRRLLGNDVIERARRLFFGSSDRINLGSVGPRK